MRAKNSTGGVFLQNPKTPVQKRRNRQYRLFKENAETGIIENHRKPPVKTPDAETGGVFLEKQENAEIGIILPYIGGKIPPIDRGFSPT